MKVVCFSQGSAYILQVRWINVQSFDVKFLLNSVYQNY